MFILALPPLLPLPPILAPPPTPLPPPSNTCPSSPILAPHAYPAPWPLPLPVHRCSFRPAGDRQLPHVRGQSHACSCASPPAPTQPSLYSCPPRHPCTDPHNCTPPPNPCTSPIIAPLTYPHGPSCCPHPGALSGRQLAMCAWAIARLQLRLPSRTQTAFVRLCREQWRRGGFSSRSFANMMWGVVR